MSLSTFRRRREVSLLTLSRAWVSALAPTPKCRAILAKLWWYLQYSQTQYIPSRRASRYLGERLRIFSGATPSVAETRSITSSKEYDRCKCTRECSSFLSPQRLSRYSRFMRSMKLSLPMIDCSITSSNGLSRFFSRPSST